MSETVYVGNLSASITETRIRELFAQYGRVHAVRLIADRYSGRSRGYAFVDMEQGGAVAAISGLNETELEGRHLRVDHARPRKPRRRRDYW